MSAPTVQLTPAEASALGPKSLPDALRARAERQPEAVALRQKDRGLWREVTYREYWEATRIVAHGLLDLGVEHGDTVAVHSENRVEWVFADIAAQGIGAIPFGIYPTSPTAEVTYYLNHASTRVLIVEDQEQADKALDADVPHLEWIVVIDMRGLRNYDDPRILPFDELFERGKRHRDAHPGEFEDRIDELDPGAPSVIVYTSGTTGPPKAAMLTQSGMLASGAAYAQYMGFEHSWDYLSYLPLCHVAEKLYTEFVALQVGFEVYFAESIEALQDDLLEVQPHFFVGVPRIWQKLHSRLLMQVANASRFKQINFRLWMVLANWVGRVRLAHRGNHTVLTRVVYAIAWVFLLGNVKRQMGLVRCQGALSGAAPISKEILIFMQGLGIPVVEGYAMTECTGLASLTRMGDVKMGSVGTPVEGTAIRIADDGEILVSGPGVFAGYLNDAEATAETVDQDGWLHTGDVGHFDDEGHLYISDRKKDIFITAGGKNVTPSLIENTLKASPYIREAMVLGDGEKYLSALIGIEFDTVSDWAQRHGLPYTTYRDLSEKSEVVELIRDAIDEANERLARVEQVKDFRLLTKELDQDDEEVTATQKVKRRVVSERFSELIDDMYRRS